MTKTRRWLRRIGAAVALLAVVCLAFTGVVVGLSSARYAARFEVAPDRVEIPPEPAPELLERGRHLTFAVAQCVVCHEGNLGGKVLVDAPGFARVVAPNLTSGNGGVAATYTDEDWLRAIRHGIAADQSAHLIMPSDDWVTLSEQDLTAIITYVKSVPPVDNAPGATALRVGARFALAFSPGELQSARRIDHSLPVLEQAPDASDAVAYGEYLVRAGGCSSCHGADLAGTPGFPGEPPAPNLTASPAGLGNWDEQDFVKALRTGITPSERQLVSPAMPWPFIGQMRDEELHAIWVYIQTLPAHP